MKTKRISAFIAFKKSSNGITKKECKKEKKRAITLAIANTPEIAHISTPKRKKEANVASRSKSSRSLAPQDTVSMNTNGNSSSGGIPCGNEESDKCFGWLINPVPVSRFHLETWEKKPLHVQHRGGTYYNGIFSCNEFDKMLRNNHLEFNRNIDVVSYRDGVRETHNPDGRAYAAVVWDYYQSGHSIRLSNPQTYSKPVWKLCSLLQEYFGSFVGANMYLTPPGSQGFAPHYDDIEAFVLQIEGKKKWKVYTPGSDMDVLPRLPSGNFTEQQLGDPVLEVELEPGDLLYFPRGFIHQAKTTDNAHSLHLTVSTYQTNTYGDLLQKILPQALECAIEENIQYRESLPKDYMNFMGIANSENNSPEKGEFFQKLIHLTKSLSKFLPCDTGADLMARDFVHSALPPCLSQEEKQCSIHGNGERWSNGRVCNATEVKPDSEIMLIRRRAVRAIREDGKLRLYHTFENTKIYKERDPQYVEVNWEYFPAVELLMGAADYVAVEKLPLKTLEEQMDLASLLYDKGLVKTKVPLSDDSDDCDA